MIDGRDERGRFAPGNPGGPGNPRCKAIAAWRQTLIASVTPEDVAEVIRELVRQAKAGKAWAIRELLSRTLGPAEAMDLADRLDAIEVALEITGD